MEGRVRVIASAGCGGGFVISFEEVMSGIIVCLLLDFFDFGTLLSEERFERFLYCEIVKRYDDRGIGTYLLHR
jgi:hypothetical protein